MNQSEKVYFKGLGNQCCLADGTKYIHFSSTDRYIVYGNIMSLLHGDDFASHPEFPEGSDSNFDGFNSTSGIPTGWTVANYDGVDEQQDQVIVYPNPVVDKLHITGTDIQSVKVFDMQGRLIHAEECGHANQVEVDFQSFAKGIHIVSVLSEGRVVNRQVVF